MTSNLQVFELVFLDHLMFFLLAILLPILGFISSKGMQDFHFEREQKLNIYYSNGFFLWIAAGVVLSVWNFQDREFTEIGFVSPRWNAGVIILTTSFALLYFLELFSKKIFRRFNDGVNWIKNLQFLPANRDEFKHYLFLALAAGICEEILFRGFLIHYLYSFFEGGEYALWIAVVLPAMFFSMAHLYQGTWAVAKISIGAIFLSGIYLWSGSLYIVIILHLMVDIISAIFARSIVAEQEKKAL